MDTKRELHAIYFADPMCSWCWGFAPTISAIRDEYGERLPVRLVMGGLRPFTDQPMTAAAKDDVKNHWQHVHDASGQPFDFSFFGKEGFVYDTDPAARAVVAVRRSDRSLEFSFFERIQRAFYAEGLDVTKPEVLADLAGKLGLDRNTFLEQLQSEGVQHETRNDYATSQRAGIRGFPTVLVGPNDEGAHILLNHGYRGPSELMPILGEVLQTLH